MTSLLEAGVAIYVAMAVALTVWVTIFIYLWRIDATTRELQRKIKQLDTQRETTTLPSASLTRVNEEPRQAVVAEEVVHSNSNSRV